MKKLSSTIFSMVLVLCTLMSFGAQAQVSSAVQSIYPLTRDLGAVKTLTAVGASTVTSADQNGYNVTRVICVFNQSAHTGSPSTTFTIQNKDVASGLYYNLISSAAITADATPTAIAAGGDVTTTSNVGAGLPIAKTWRVSITVAGSATPVTTATVGCSVQ